MRPGRCRQPCEFFRRPPCGSGRRTPSAGASRSVPQPRRPRRSSVRRSHRRHACSHSARSTPPTGAGGRLARHGTPSCRSAPATLRERMAPMAGGNDETPGLGCSRKPVTRGCGGPFAELADPYPATAGTRWGSAESCRTARENPVGDRAERGWWNAIGCDPVGNHATPRCQDVT